MFENLSERLERSFKILKGEGKIPEINVAETLKDVRRALLDADVNYKVAKQFTDTVKTKALGQDVLTAVKPAGLARMKFSKFILFTTLGAMCWNIVLAAIGYGFHAVIPEDELISKVQMYSHEILYILIAICVFIVGFLIYKGMKKLK